MGTRGGKKREKRKKKKGRIVENQRPHHHANRPLCIIYILRKPGGERKEKGGADSVSTQHAQVPAHFCHNVFVVNECAKTSWGEKGKKGKEGIKNRPWEGMR